MEKKYIPSKAFRGIITLLTKMMDLPQTANINVGGENKEFTVFHRIELRDYESKDEGVGSTIIIKSYAIDGAYDTRLEVSSVTEINQSIKEINPEYDFTENQIFWAGAPTKVFKDYMPLNDKKFGSGSWCASYERELYYPTFLINEDDPIATIQIRFDMLKKFDTVEEKRTFVGSIGLDGDFMPSRLPAEAFEEVKSKQQSTKANKVDVVLDNTARSEAVSPSVFRSNRTGATLKTKLTSIADKLLSAPVDRELTFG